MKFFWISILSLWLTTVTVFSQNKVLDSLYGQLELADNSANRVEIMAQLSRGLSTVDIPKGIDIGMKAYYEAKEQQNLSGLAKACSSLGTCYLKLSDMENALKYFFQSLEIGERLNDELIISYAYNNLGAAHIDMGEKTAAVGYLKLARKSFLKLDLPNYAIYPTHNIGTILLGEGKYPQALQFFEKNLKFLAENEDLGMEGVTYNNIGRVYYFTKDFPKAIENFELSIQSKIESGNQGGIASSRMNIFEIYLELGQIKKAEKILKQVESEMSPDADLTQKQNLLDGQYQFAKEKGQFKDALTFFEQHTANNDSLKKLTQSLEIRTLKEQGKFKTQQYQISNLESTNASQKEINEWQFLAIILVGVLAGLSIIAIAFLLYSNQNRRKLNRILAAKKDVIGKQSEEIALQNDLLTQKNNRLTDLNRQADGLIQMVAHDLKSPLNKSLGLASLLPGLGPLNEEQNKIIALIEKVNEKGQELIADLLELNNIKSRKKLKLSKIDLKLFFQNQIQSYVREGELKQITVQLEKIEPGLSLNSVVSYLERIIDNLVTNAIKFCPSGKNVWIKVEKKDQGILLVIKDDGPGFTESDKEKMFTQFQKLSARPTAGESSTGLGLAIVKSLVVRLKGKISLISEKGQGAEFSIYFPDL